MSNFVLRELRLAFRACAPPRSSPQSRQAFFSSYRHLQKRHIPSNPPKASSDSKSNLSVAKRPETTPPEAQREAQREDNSTPTKRSDERRKYVEPRQREYTDVDTGKRVPIPMKVMPKAQLTPDLVLDAKERMQLEYITRRLPKREPGKVFRERLLIYHRGLARTNLTAFLKVTGLTLMSFTLAVWAPAYYTFGAPWWTVASILFVGCSPFLAINYRTKPIITWIYLILPAYARQSPKAALEYARNLPDNALLQLHYMRTIPFEADVLVQLRDLKPVSSSKLRPLTFEWAGTRIDRGPWYRPNLTQFSVRPKSGTGKEKRDVIPGLWEAVYKRITGVESDTSAKWKR